MNTDTTDIMTITTKKKRNTYIEMVIIVILVIALAGSLIYINQTKKKVNTKDRSSDYHEVTYQGKKYRYNCAYFISGIKKSNIILKGI